MNTTPSLKFNVSGSGQEYLDLARTLLLLKAKITKGNSTALELKEQVGPVDVSLNEQLIYPSTNTYPYHAMIETLLNYGEDAKSSRLTMAKFYKDTPKKMDAINPVTEDAYANIGLKACYAFAKQIHTVDTIGPIHSNIFF